jgi:SAM-dependent methyltransferase
LVLNIVDNVKGKFASLMFGKSGLARLSDLQTSQWKQGFDILRDWHDEFSANETNFRSPTYAWPTRPLYCWSRVWEYPFAYHHLSRFVSTFTVTAKVADIGSGVTFFPFAIADLGVDVFCADIDPVCGLDLSRATKVMRNRGNVAFRLIEGKTLPFEEAELDAVYCISVLEHIPDFENTIAEISRCLKAGGLFVLTFDVAIEGIEGIAGEHRVILMKELNRHFTLVTKPEETPLCDALLSDRGPYPMQSRDTAWFRFKQAIKPLIGKTPVSAPLIGVESAVLIKAPT